MITPSDIYLDTHRSGSWERMSIRIISGLLCAPYSCKLCAKRNSHLEIALQVAVLATLTDCYLMVSPSGPFCARV